MSISITYNTSTESNITQNFSTATELKTFISNNKANFTGAMKVVCDNSITDCSKIYIIDIVLFAVPRRSGT